MCKIISSNCLIHFRAMGGWSLYQQLRVQGRTHSGQDTLSSQSHSQPHPHSLRLVQCRHASSSHLPISGIWEETKYLERTRPDMRTCKLYRQWLLTKIIFFSHQCYNKTTIEQNHVMQGPAIITYRYLNRIGSLKIRLSPT